MKKNLCIIIAILAFILPFTAMAVEEFYIPTVKDSDGAIEYFQSTAVNDALYLLSGRGYLYRLDETGKETQHIPLHNANPEYEKATPSQLRQMGIPEGMETPDWLQDFFTGINRLYSDGTTLYGLNITTGALYRVLLSSQTAELHAQCMLDFSTDSDSAQTPTVYAAVIIGKQAFVAMSWTGDGTGGKLYAFDLKSGSRTLMDVKEPVFEIAPYHPGQLLLLKKDLPLGRSISIFDITTHEQRKLYQKGTKGISADISDILYDASKDRVILQSKEQTIALAGDETTKTVNFFQPHSQNSRAILPSGAMVIADSKIYIRDIDTEKEPPKPLRVACNSLSVLEFDFADDNPDVPLICQYLSPQEAEKLFTNHMNISSSDIDIYEIPIEVVLENAVNKGYYLPLDNSPAISQRVSLLYPFIAEKIMDGSHIAALPKLIEHQTVAYSKYAMAQVGLTAEDMPHNFLELMEFCLKWEESYGKSALDKGISLFEVDANQAEIELLSMILQQYFALMETDIKTALDKEDELTILMDKLNQMKKSLSGQVPNDNSYTPTSSYSVNATPSFLFSLYASSDPGRRNFTLSRRSVSDFVPMNLAIFEGMKPLFLITGSAFIINPYSKNKEGAERLLSFYAENFPVADGAALFVDTAPTESRDYTILKNRYVYAINRLKEKLPYAKNSEKKDIEAEIIQNEAKLQSVDLIKWEVSQEALDDYQKILTQNTVDWLKKSLYANTLDRIWRQYVQENMDTKRFVEELIHNFQMIVTENR